MITRLGTNVNIHRHNMPVEEILYSGYDNTELYGLYIKHSNPLGIILFFHGNAGSVSNWLSFTKQYYKWGYSVFMMEYRGFGKCDGIPNEEHIYKDAMTAYNYIIDVLEYPREKIILNGKSLGGAVAINLASKVPAAALIVDSSFTSMPDMAHRYIPFIGYSLCNFSFNSINLIDKITIPCLIIHSREDSLIPFKMGEQLYHGATLSSNRVFVESTGGHNSWHWNDDVRDNIIDFCKESIQSNNE